MADIPFEDLHPGASNVNDQYAGGSLSPEQVKRMADELEAEARLTGGAPSTTPLTGDERNGPPRGYGKYGDLA